MKYRVKTDQFKFLEEGEIIHEGDKCHHDGQWVDFTELIECFPNWFEPVDQGQAGQYRVTTCLLESNDEGNVISEGVYSNLLSAGCPESWFEPVEQEEEEPIVINGYEAEIYDDKSGADFGCQPISKKFIQQLDNLLWNHKFRMLDDSGRDVSVRVRKLKERLNE